MKLDLTSDQIRTSMVVEASAGTGKTYAVAALVARELAVRADLRIGHILITTFTRNAAMELRHRIRKRIISTASALRSSSVPINPYALPPKTNFDSKTSTGFSVP